MASGKWEASSNPACSVVFAMGYLIIQDKINGAEATIYDAERKITIFKANFIWIFSFGDVQKRIMVMVKLHPAQNFLSFITSSTDGSFDAN